MIKALVNESISKGVVQKSNRYRGIEGCARGELALVRIVCFWPEADWRFALRDVGSQEKNERDTNALSLPRLTDAVEELGVELGMVVCLLDCELRRKRIATPRRQLGGRFGYRQWPGGEIDLANLLRF